jgi:hypothetical protein
MSIINLHDLKLHFLEHTLHCFNYEYNKDEIDNLISLQKKLKHDVDYEKSIKGMFAFMKISSDGTIKTMINEVMNTDNEIEELEKNFEYKKENFLESHCKVKSLLKLDSEIMDKYVEESIAHKKIN